MKRPFFALIAGCLLGFSIALTPVLAQNCTDGASCVVEMEKRANTGDVVAIMWLADYYAMGAGESEDKAVFWLRKYVSLSREESLLLRQLQLKSKSTAEQQEALASLRNMAKSGNAFAALELAKFYKESDRSCWLHWNEVAAKLGNKQAMKALAGALSEPGAEQDEKSAAAWLFVLSASSTPNGYASRSAMQSANKIISTRELPERGAVLDHALQICRVTPGCNPNEVVTAPDRP